MNSKQFLDNLSTHLKNSIARAISLAASLNEQEVLPIHLLIALAEEPGSVAAEILKKSKFNSQIVADSLRSRVKVPATTSTNPIANLLPELNHKSKEVLEKAMLSAYEHEHNYIGTEHVLHGLIICEDPLVDAILKQQKISFDDLEDQIHTVFASVSKFPAVEDVIDAMDQIEQMIDQPPTNHPQSTPRITPNHSGKKKHAPKQQTALEMFTIDLTAKQLQRKIDPVIGREREISRLIHILARRHKNNPVLVGEPGVGKTAIVEGLARRIASGDVPDILKDKKILSLDLTLLLAGTIYRGEFEGRLKHIMDELSNREDCILFIDEIHNIIGAGSNQGTMDAANMLKPALARGQLRCIGATTFDEYKKYISNDPALSRRFLSIHVEEPSANETIQILEGVKENFDEYHGTLIQDDAIRAAVSLSGRYVHDNFFPDKAIDLIDEAAASVRSKRPTPPYVAKLRTLRDRLQELKKKKEEAVISEQFDGAMEIKNELAALEKELHTIEKKYKKKPSTKPEPVTAEDVTNVLADRLGIDSSLLIADEWTSLNELGTRLSTHIIGQEPVIHDLVRTLKQRELRGIEERKPRASFLFVGPSGVGKTELAKQLAKELYQSPNALIKLDMSEFSESHGVSKLLGSPAGYVGYKERNRFLDEVQKKPYAVVLYDEIDKAHRDVLKLLLQILDEGELTDSTGKKISFKNSIIILTANIGAELFQTTGIGFEKQTNDPIGLSRIQTAVTARIKEELGNALMSRLDQISLFTPLSEEHISTIVKKHTEEIFAQVRNVQQIVIQLDSTILPSLTKECFSSDSGARYVTRHLERVIHEQVMTVLDKKQRKKRYTLKKSNQGYRLI